MAQISITLPTPLNVSLQAGDIVYYVELASSTVGGFQVNQGTSVPIEIGPVVSITNGVIVVENETTNQEPSVGDFILFGKNRRINEASLVGYFAEFEFKNNSKTKAELFSTGCQIQESSK